jgi:transketolase
MKRSSKKPNRFCGLPTEEVARLIRVHALIAIYHAKSGHPGGSLSVADILAVLYNEILCLMPKRQNPHWEHRDRLVFSKGHACPSLYAALAFRGFFSLDELVHLRKHYHWLEGHPDVKIPGVDAPSGSLGIGVSQALGMALALKEIHSSARVFAIIGDGDMNEGMTREALVAVPHYRLTNLTVIFDSNKYQGEGAATDQMNTGPVGQWLASLGWRVLDIDGHDLVAIRSALAWAQTEKRPTFIVANTVKGKGVSFFESDPIGCQGSLTLSRDQYEKAIAELGGAS